MAPSPHPQPRPLLALMAVLLGAACALGLAGLTTWAHTARADAQPALAVAVKSGGSSATQTQYTVTATGFPTGTAFTETMGDGSAISPATGQVNASGGFTIIWTLDATTKYCGTITAQAGTASASASFWVALVSDSQSGTPCQGSGGGGAGTPTPATSPTPSTTATPNATASPAAPLPTSTPSAGGSSSGSGRLHAILAAIPWRWVGIGGGALLALIILMAIVSALGKRQPRVGERTSARRAAMGGVARFGSGPGYSNTRQRAAQWQAPPTSTAQRYVPYDGADSRRGAGGGPDHYTARRPVPDQRWTRSQPGARGERGGTSTRERAARRNAEWEQWSGRR